MVMSHRGRPEEGKADEENSMAPIAADMSAKLGKEVRLVKDYLDGGFEVAPGECVLLENVRFNAGEKKDDEALSKKYAALCDVFVMDAFGTAHRAQASTHGAGKFAPTACAGLLLADELDNLAKALANPARPMVAIVGGSKVSTKLTVLEALSEKVGENNIFVVVGYKKELIMERHPQLIYIYNNKYTQTNTAKSLLMAISKINDDVLWMNGDVFFEKEIIDILMNVNGSSCLVNNEKCGDEEIKYTCYEGGFIKNISKEVKNGLGEALGINLLKKEDLYLFKNELEKVSDHSYFEKALENLTLKKAIELKPIHIENYFCVEIDFPEDLERVNEYISNKK